MEVSLGSRRRIGFGFRVLNGGFFDPIVVLKLFEIGSIENRICINDRNKFSNENKI